MSLTDIMSGADLSAYPQIGLLIFLLVFVLVAWRALRKPARQNREWAAIAVDDEPVRASENEKGVRDER